MYGEWEVVLSVLLEANDSSGRTGTGKVRRTTWSIEALGKQARMVHGHGGSCRLNATIVTYWYSMSRITLSGLDAVG